LFNEGEDAPILMKNPHRRVAMRISKEFNLTWRFG